MANAATHTTELARRGGPTASFGAAGISRSAVDGAYAALMQLTSDAVFIFDGTCQILAANERAAQLTGLTHEQLLATTLGALVFNPLQDLEAAPTTVAELPFETDGTMAVLALRLATGGAEQVVLRCDRVSAPGYTYMATVKPFDVPAELEQEHDRLVDELALANHRLSGTLKIVLDTIDAQDVDTLFTQVVEQIAETLEASGAVLFLAEAGGFRLHKVTHSLEGRRVPQYMNYRDHMVAIAARASSSMRLHLAKPTEESLRAGAMAKRELIDEETQRSYRILARNVPPFVSFIYVPVWFADRVIALIEVGWADARAVRKDDARLMDTVAQYLSVEFAAAISTMRTQRTQRLDAIASHLHASLESADIASHGDLSVVAKALANDLNVSISPIRAGSHGEANIINLPSAGVAPLEPDVIGAAPAAPQIRGIEFPFSLDELVAGKVDQNIAVVPITRSSKLAAWLEAHGCSASGVVFDLGVIAGTRRASLLLRPEDDEPIDDTQLDFLRRVAIDIHETAQAHEQRSKDTHISQALQSGMKNVLQKVDGIYAEGLYSSATAAALVGGDFYDLIALPNRRACVILGDVSGKGVEAASVSAAVKTALGAYAWEGQTPARMVRLLNDFLLGFSRLETFATLFVGMIDLTHGQLTYCSAGHPPAIFLHADTHEMQSLDEQSGVVGAFKGMTYHDGHVNIKVGDGLLLYTDGVTEARSTSGAFFAETGLHDAVMEERAGGIEGLTGRLLERLDAFTGRSLEDDVAMVALRFDDVGKAKK